MEQIEYQPDDPPPQRATRLIHVPGYGYVEAPRHVWWYVALVMAVLLTPPASLWLFLRSFDADAYRPTIIAMIRQATGREVEIRGKIRLVGHFSPRLILGPIVMAAAPGSRVFVGQIGQAEAALTLGGLIWGAPSISRLILDGPDIQIETGMDVPPGAVGAGPTSPAQLPTALGSLQSIQIRDGRVTWRDAKTATSIAVNFKRMVAGVNEDGGITLSSELVVGRDRITVNGEFGSPARLFAPDPASPWPVSIKTQARGASLTMQGSVGRPLELAGYNLQVDGFLLESRNFRAYFPDSMPGLRKLALSLRLSDRGGGVPDISALSFTVGASDLAPLLPGSRIDKLEIRADGMDQALRVETAGVLSGSALKAALVLGTPAGLLQAAASLGFIPAIARRDTVGFPIDLIAELGGSEISANGALANPAQFAGLDLAVAATLRDVSKLERLFQTRLPAWTEARMSARVGEMPGGLGAGVALRDLVVKLPAGDVAGTASVEFGNRPKLLATLGSQGLDFDALGQSFAHVPLGPAPPLPPPTPPGMRSGPQMFSQASYALGVLGLGDLDVSLKLATARVGGLPVSDVGVHLAMVAGRVNLDRLIMTTPGGGVVEASFDYDTGAPTAPMRLAVHAPGLAIKPILLALQRAEDIVGTVAASVDITAAGRDPHGIASSLSGRFGIALVDGELNTTIFNQYIFAALRLTGLPLSLMQSATGASRMRCFAAAMTADRGKVEVQT
ncbi:MAG: AsmA family protein, partial [Acetobacteraceae bacterium]|nr:AsmA family protein [Acetobacteraceae bacterium]